METRFDSYYEKEIPYKMTLEELASLEYKREEDILAYFRQIGIDNIRIIIPATPSSSIMKSPFPGIALCSSEKVSTVCRMINDPDPLYNPLVERNTILPEHWYHPYKIRFTPIEYDGVLETFYFSDFCSLLNNGSAKIVRNVNLYAEKQS